MSRRWRRRRVPGLARRNRRVDRDRRAHRRRVALGTAKLAVVASLAGVVGWHGYRLAETRGWFDVFRVREVRVVGIDVAHPSVLVAEAGLMGAELHWWSPLRGYAEGVLRDPLVAEARLERRFPDGLVLEVVERRPVALLATDRLVPADSTGRTLPVDPFHAGWDAPVMVVEPGEEAIVRDGRVRDANVRRTLRWLGEVERRFPVLAREISAIDLDAEGIARVRLANGGPLVIDGETPFERLALVDDVLRDLREKEVSYREVDLRFADQIVVRGASPRVPDGSGG